jgi:hypothetical protein
MTSTGIPAAAQAQKPDTVDGRSDAEVQEGGPVGARAVPTALRWKVRPISPPKAALRRDAGPGGSTAIRSSDGLAGGSSSVVSTHGGRAKIPELDGWGDGTGSAEAAATAAR